MKNLTLEANQLEGAVCGSKEKQLRVRRHSVSGHRWVEVGGRRFVGRRYVEAVAHLHSQNRLELSSSHEDDTVYELGQHSCTKILGR